MNKTFPYLEESFLLSGDHISTLISRVKGEMNPELGKGLSEMLWTSKCIEIAAGFMERESGFILQIIILASCTI